MNYADIEVAGDDGCIAIRGHDIFCTDDVWIMADAGTVTVSASRFKALIEAAVQQELDEAAVRQELELQGDSS